MEPSKAYNPQTHEVTQINFTRLLHQTRRPQKHDPNDQTTFTKRSLSRFTSTDSTDDMSISLKIYCIILNTTVWVGLFVVAFYLILPERELSLVLARIFGGSLLGYTVV